MAKRRSGWLWSATVFLWIASVFGGPTFVSLPWVWESLPEFFVDPIYGPRLFALFGLAFIWLVLMIAVGLRHHGRARWIAFAIPVLVTLTALTVPKLTHSPSPADVEVSHIL
jgi:uncharacterized membrane protein YhaH (DUF805 family)